MKVYYNEITSFGSQLSIFLKTKHFVNFSIYSIRVFKVSNLSRQYKKLKRVNTIFDLINSAFYIFTDQPEDSVSKKKYVVLYVLI